MPVATQEPALNPELIPFGFQDSLLSGRWAYDHIRWMRQKDRLGQDIFLVGMHGPLRRWLALVFCEKAGREMEYLALTQDTTESDLKQRREILPGGSSMYFDQSAVNAALYGRILIVEGLEKVERNVMPVLNNLLENREIALEDGRFLLPRDRYDQLTEQQRIDSRLVPVHPRFRVIALGVPVPPFPGNPLDPPLRSRFQARRIDPAPRRGLLSAIRNDWAPTLDPPVAQALVNFSRGIFDLGMATGDATGVESAQVAFHEIMYVGEAGVLSMARLMDMFPQIPFQTAVSRAYPEAALYTLTQLESRDMVTSMIAGLNEQDDPDFVSEYRVISSSATGPEEVTLGFAPEQGGDTVELTVRGGAGIPSLPQGETLQDHHWHLITGMLQSHCVGRDLCVIGSRGSGKSFIARQFAMALGYAPVETLFVYADMTSRDLLQRRTTGSSQETLWQPTPLAIALRTGRLAILDGVNRLPMGTISALLRLIEDREITLFDGSRYVKPERYQAMQEDLGLSEADLEERGIFCVHPSFRILALATPPTRGQPWLTNEMLHLFHFFQLDMDISSETGREHAATLLRSVVPNLSDEVPPKLAAFAANLAEVDADSASTTDGSMSVRMMLRVARRAVAYPDDLSDAVAMNMMTMFMPSHARGMINGLMNDAGMEGELENARSFTSDAVVVDERDGVLSIGDIKYEIVEPENPELVPDIVFFEIPSHTLILRSMLKDYMLGEHLLLMGNQGVGKNKLTDRLLQVMRRERDYIQLHRDTTVPTLTINPSLQDGMIVWEDSPLVRAMSRGHVLVVDEFDKAPVEVVCVLKGLLEDGEILLADGRRFVSPKSVLFDGAELPGSTASGEPNLLETRVVQIHPGFRVVALANRPGYPFLGNDFFAEMGDVFACHAIDNPDQNSEIALLRSYAPNVNIATITRLTAAFMDLRQMTDEGQLLYPYSTRELVNIVLHLSRYPDDSMTEVLDNVLSFDSFDRQLLLTLFQVFRRHGIPVGSLNDRELIEDYPVPERALQIDLPTPDLHTTWRPLMDGDGLQTLPILKAGSDELVGGTQLRGSATLEGTGRWRPLRDMASARLDRFTEELFGWRVTGDSTPMHMTALPDNMVAILTTRMQMQIADPDNNQVQLLTIFPPSPLCSKPPMTFVPTAGRIVLYSILRGAMVIDPVSGEINLIAVELDPPPADDSEGRNVFRRTPVILNDGLAHAGIVMLHHEHSDTIHFFHNTGDASDWQMSKLKLPGVQIDRVEVLFDTQLLVHSISGPSYQCVMPDSVMAGSSATVMPLEVERELSDPVELQTAEEHLFLSPPMPTPPIISAALGEPTGISHGVCGTDIMGGYTMGFSPDGVLAGESQANIFSFMKPPAMLGDLSMPTEYHCAWLSQTEAALTIVSKPNSVNLDVLDYSRGSFYTVPLGPSPGQAAEDAEIASAPGAEARGDADPNAPVRWQRWAMISSVVEMSDGRVALMQNDGFIRVLEFRESELAAAEQEWLSMHGKRREKKNGRRRRGGGRRNGRRGRNSRRHMLGEDEDDDDDDDDDWDDDEWEDGVITNVNDDGTVDVELESGEEITEMDPDLLDVEDDDIGVGTEVGVNMEDVEWEEYSDDEDEDWDDEDGLYEDEEDDWDEEDWDEEDEDWDEEDWDEEEGEYVTGTIESFNEDGTANIRLSNGELLENVNLDDMIPMDGEDGEMSEGDGVMIEIEGEGEGEGEGSGSGRGRGRGKGGKKGKGKRKKGGGGGGGGGGGKGKGKGKGKGRGGKGGKVSHGMSVFQLAS